MYSKLNYNANASNGAQTVLADITALLTGETVVGNLTGDISTGTILTTYTTVAYTLFDDISADQKVFRVPIHDDPTNQFMYMELFTYSGNEVHIRLWSTWEVVGHTGTGASYYTTTTSKLCDLLNYTTAAFSIELTATNRHLVVRTLYNGGTVMYTRGYMQWDRGEAWDTYQNGKLPVLLLSTDTAATFQNYTLPHIRSDGAEYSLINTGLYMHTRYGNSQKDDLNLLIGGTSSAARGLNDLLESVHNMYEFGFSFLSDGERFLTGKIADMYLATYQNGAQGDIISISGNDYIIWEFDTNYRVAIRKG